MTSNGLCHTVYWCFDWLDYRLMLPMANGHLRNYLMKIRKHASTRHLVYWRSTHSPCSRPVCSLDHSFHFADTIRLWTKISVVTLVTCVLVSYVVELVWHIWLYTRWVQYLCPTITYCLRSMRIVRMFTNLLCLDYGVECHCTSTSLVGCLRRESHHVLVSILVVHMWQASVCFVFVDFKNSIFFLSLY